MGYEQIRLLYRAKTARPYIPGILGVFERIVALNNEHERTT
jgi:hypothetical protein